MLKCVLNVFHQFLTKSFSHYPKVFHICFNCLLGDNYFGKVTVQITLRKAPAKQLFLDFRGYQIGNLSVNGTKVKEEGGVSSFRNHKIFLPTSLLQIGEDKKNIVSIF